MPSSRDHFDSDPFAASCHSTTSRESSSRRPKSGSSRDLVNGRTNTSSSRRSKGSSGHGEISPDPDFDNSSGGDDKIYPSSRRTSNDSDVEKSRVRTSRRPSSGGDERKHRSEEKTRSSRRPSNGGDEEIERQSVRSSGDEREHRRSHSKDSNDEDDREKRRSGRRSGESSSKSSSSSKNISSSSGSSRRGSRDEPVPQEDVDYGYGESAEDFGYGDAAPANKSTETGSPVKPGGRQRQRRCSIADVTNAASIQPSAPDYGTESTEFGVGDDSGNRQRGVSGLGSTSMANIAIPMTAMEQPKTGARSGRRGSLLGSVGASIVGGGKASKEEKLRQAELEAKEKAKAAATAASDRRRGGSSLMDRVEIGSKTGARAGATGSYSDRIMSGR